MHLPMADAVLEIDQFEATVSTIDEKALLPKRPFELVTKLCVPHDALPSKAGRYHVRRGTRRLITRAKADKTQREGKHFSAAMLETLIGDCSASGCAVGQSSAMRRGPTPF